MKNRTRAIYSNPCAVITYMVELRRIELLTSALRTQHSTN